MKERSKKLTLESLDNYKPPEVKQRKRTKKSKEKKKEEEETILLNKKTGEEVEESSSDNRSTNPSNMTFSCSNSEFQLSELGNGLFRFKISLDDTTEKASQIGKEDKGYVTVG